MTTVQKIKFGANGSGLVQSGSATSVTAAQPSAQESVSNPIKTQSSIASAPSTQTKQEKQSTATQAREEKTLKTAKTVSYVSAGVALASLGFGIAIISKGKKQQELKQLVKKSFNEVQEGFSEIEEKFQVLSTKIEENASVAEHKINDLAKWHDGMIDGVKTELEGKIGSTKYIPLAERNLAFIDGLQLLQNVANGGKKINLPKNVVEYLNNVAKKHIYNGIDHPKVKVLNKDSTVWSITAESFPEKEGGLGEVPVQISRNLNDVFDINNYLIRPLNEIPGKSKIVSEDGKLTYFYNLDKTTPYKMEIDKVASFETSAFRNGKYENQTVDVYYGIDPKFGSKKLLFKNADYFKGSGLYEDSQTATETERFAFFGKAVYDFMKLKADTNSMTSYEITNKAIFDEIKFPDAMIMNDWHTGALAGLIKLKAPVEGAFKELNSGVAEQFANINLINVVHNLDYQGSSWQHASEIINTLFDKYAYDIYENANTGFGYKDLNKVLTIGNNVNLANMAACLSNKVKPVSPTYAKEVAEQNERSGALQHLMATRLSQGTMRGSSNGWDKIVNEVSTKNIGEYNNFINGDKLTIFSNEIKKISNISKSVKSEIDKLFVKGVDPSNINNIIESLKKLDVPEINSTLEDLSTKGITKLRSFKVYTDKDSIDDIMAARKQDKALLFNHLKSMIEYNKTHEKKLFNIMELDNTDLSEIDPNNLDNIPFINMVARFVSQKGIDNFCESVIKLYKEWPSKYPGKPKPLILMGGADGEGGSIKKIAVDAKKLLGKDGNLLVYVDGFAPSNIYEAGSDLTVYSSNFEPDGSKWESLNRGTPAACTRVGGHVDSIIDGVNGYLTKRTIPEINASGQVRKDAVSDDLLETYHRFLNDFNDKEKYKQMVRNTIDGDHSWLKFDSDGNITGGALIDHMKDLNFDLKAFSEIKLPEEV